MAQIVTTIKKFIGTAAERAAMTEAARNASNPGSTFLESDTGRLYVLDAGTPHTWREKLTNVAGDVQLTGSKEEQASAQATETAATVENYNRHASAMEIGVYVESGDVRVRSDGDPATATTGVPLGEGFFEFFTVAEISVYFVTNATITVVSR